MQEEERKGKKENSREKNGKRGNEIIKTANEREGKKRKYKEKSEIIKKEGKKKKGNQKKKTQ